MEHISFFDCNCWVGMRSVMHPGSFYKLEDLEKKMEHYGIEKALVYHAMAREYNPSTGNNILLEEIAEHKSLLPIWVVMHHHTREFSAPDILLEQMKKYNVRAVRMFPSPPEQNYNIAEWNCGELLKTLEKHKIPLFIGIDQMTWNELYELANNHPNLNIILTELSYRMDRNLYALMARFPHIYLETSGYKVHHGNEEICSIYGAERLIFGSGMPVFSGAAVSMVLYARISDREKKLIARENMEKLIQEVNL